MTSSRSPRRATKSLWRDNSLTVALVAIFVVLLGGLIATGYRTYNAEQLEHGQAAVSFAAYFGTGHFWEALFENWESEFLQMAAYIVLTALLIQRGSAESKNPDEHEAVDDDPRATRRGSSAPWPVRRGGFWLFVYENSLALAFTALFFASVLGHALGGLAEHNADLREHGQATMSLWNYVSGSAFWFESFQNWQSEFLAVLAIVTLSIWLRQRGSPESKPVAASHRATGAA